MKRILINSSYGNELRVALVDGAKLYDLDTELSDKTLLKGSIFKATVSRIESSLDAAFVNFGSERHGFLPLKDLSSEFYEKNKEGKRVCILKEQQEIIVQVTKEERGTKGAALTTQIALAGRFLVLIPNSDRAGGISRRISGEERDDIKEALKSLNIPEGMGAIVRTAGLGRSSEELSLDLAYLLALWGQISQTTVEAPSPSLIYRDDKLIVRVVKDYFRDDIEEILIDDQATYDEAKQFINAVIPDHADKVKYYDEEIPLFNRYQIESQIELAFQREISLPSGGSIVIDPTEAMTAVDVNSARSTKGKDIEDTAFQTNLEAAKEVARQLRLRDVGGLIVIDFIDMSETSNQEKVENAFRKAVHGDRARVQISGISRFGLLEISRQRLRPSLNETYDIEHVLVRGPRSLGQSILRIISEDSIKENTGEIHAFVPSDVASYLLNEKRNELMRIEKATETRIWVIADPYKARPYYKVIRIKASDVKPVDSYNMTPDSPTPTMDWRDDKNQSKGMKPLVNAITPPKMPKKAGPGVMQIIKKAIGMDTKEDVKKKAPKGKPQNRNNQQRKRPQNKNPNAKKPNNKPQHKKPNPNQNKSHPKKEEVKTDNKVAANKQSANKTQTPKNDSKGPQKQSKDQVNKNETKKVVPKKQDVKKDIAAVKEPAKVVEKKVEPKKPSGLQPVESKPKKKAAVPTRAANDPRYKS
jgi:ribonuclease E